MLRYVVLFLILAVSQLVLAQQELHTFYLEDGVIFIGEIIEKTPEGHYFVKTLAGMEMVILKWQIISLDLEEENLSYLKSYGGKKAIGFSMFGSGPFGINYHYGIGNNFYVDAGIQYSLIPLHIGFGGTTVVKSGVSTIGGMSYYLGKHLTSKRKKVTSLGIFFQTGHTFSNYNSTKIAAGFSAESFKTGFVDRSFVAEFGFAWKIRHWVDTPIPLPYSEDKDIGVPVFHLRFIWSFYYDKDLELSDGNL